MTLSELARDWVVGVRAFVSDGRYRLSELRGKLPSPRRALWLCGSVLFLTWPLVAGLLVSGSEIVAAWSSVIWSVLVLFPIARGEEERR